MMRGRFKLAIQRATTAHFALVEVGLTPGPEDAVLIKCPIRGKGWTDPIIVGVEEALHEMRRRGVLTQPVQVEILDFQGLYVDTSDLQAKTAAYVATARAVLGSNEWPTVVCPHEMPGELRVEWGPVGEMNSVGA